MKISLLCGGPSLEKGISLNSARSVLDHLESGKIEIVPIYFDSKKNAYKISKNQLYSNTPSDFDFKLLQTAKPLTENSLIRLLKNTDIVFPVMHGSFGEDGEIQSFLEKHQIPFVGSGSDACKKAFDKFTSNEFVKQNGFFTWPSTVLKIYHRDHRRIIENFFKKHDLKRAIVKPAIGGSSIGVFSVSTPEEALDKVKLLFSKRMDTRVVIEPFAAGKEFTIIILENKFGLPVALPPTEIETDYTEHQIFDFRKKYLPTRQVTWHCPPRFSDEVVEKIQARAEEIFTSFNMKGFGRFDGWVLPDGNIWFCDFNPISGMEQNSFLFQQASRIGLTHQNTLHYILEQSCRHYNIKFPRKNAGDNSAKKRKPINIILGGNNSEKQVSLMSGTNAWLKLRQSKKYCPQLFLLDPKESIWQLPYHLALNHTVEEITDNCESYQLAKKRLGSFEKRARIRLGFLEDKDKKEFFEPHKITLKKFLEQSKFVFIALHGGDGENGKMQKLLADNNIKFNGPDEKTSKLCINKWDTSCFIKNLKIKGLVSIPGQILKTNRLLSLKNNGLENFWKELRKNLEAETIIVKPSADGCSTGVAHLYSQNDLKKYIDLLAGKKSSVPKNTFKNQLDIIELSPKIPEKIIFEKFIDTNTLKVRGNKLKHRQKTGWLEITIGVIEINGKIKVFNPSITIANGEVLTVEEKFQGGTGINITPPPTSVIKLKFLKKIKKLIEEVAIKIGINGYSRIDAFVNIKSGNLMIIEINTLPALTPSTVLYHQALAENPSIFPRELLEILIENK